MGNTRKMVEENCSNSNGVLLKGDNPVKNTVFNKLSPFNRKSNNSEYFLLAAIELKMWSSFFFCLPYLLLLVVLLLVCY